MAITTSTVIYEKRDRVAYITMNRPEELNALNTEIVNGINDAFTDFRDDNDALVCVFTGAGGRAHRRPLGWQPGAASRLLPSQANPPARSGLRQRDG